MVSVVALPVGVIALIVYAGLPDEDGERTRAALILQITLATLLLLAGPVACIVVARSIRSASADAKGSSAPATSRSGRRPAPTTPLHLRVEGMVQALGIT